MKIYFTLVIIEAKKQLIENSSSPLTSLYNNYHDIRMEEFLLITYVNTNTTGGPPQPCGQQGAGASSRNNTGHNMGKRQWKKETTVCNCHEIILHKKKISQESREANPGPLHQRATTLQLRQAVEPFRIPLSQVFRMEEGRGSFKLLTGTPTGKNP